MVTMPLQRTGTVLERSLHAGWRPLGLALFVGLLGYLLYRVGTPVWTWGGLWTVYFLYVGTYCIRNFFHCRETHCAVTGPVWTVVGLISTAGAAGLIHVGDWGLVWILYLLGAVVGYLLQAGLSAKLGRPTLTRR